MGKLKLNIKQAEPKDLQTLERFYCEELLSEYPLPLIKRTIIFNILQNQTAVPTHFILGHDQGKILGLTIVRFRSSLQAYEIECLTKKACRRRGVAFSLIKFALQKCMANGIYRFVAYIAPANTNSIMLFQKLGFKLEQIYPYPELDTYTLHSKPSSTCEKI